MAIKTFTAGAVLTAADTNTYLTNSGLVYVKSQTVGTGVSSVNVTSAFSTDYDNYLVSYTGGVGSSATSIRLKLGTTTAGYYSQLIYCTYAAATPLANVPDNNGAIFTFVGQSSTTFARIRVEIQNPFSSVRTQINGSYVDTTLSGHFGGFLDNATSYTDFTISPGSGTLTGGTITVYGYRKA